MPEYGEWEKADICLKDREQMSAFGEMDPGFV